MHTRLNMIVKNEAAVIHRCVATVKPWVDRWASVDMRSTAGAQDILCGFMQGVRGLLQEWPCHNVARDRNKALAIARALAKYLLFIEANKMLDLPPISSPSCKPASPEKAA